VQQTPPLNQAWLGLVQEALINLAAGRERQGVHYHKAEGTM